MSSTSVKSKGKPKRNWATLPLTRVSTIMRSSPDVSSISPDAIALTAHSAELFIAQLAKDAYEESINKSKLDYNDLSSVVNSNPRMTFLQDILPQKIKVKDYKKLLQNIQQNDQNINDSNEDIDEENDDKNEDMNEEESDD